MEILICKMSYFVNWKSQWFELYLSFQTIIVIIVISEAVFFCDTVREITQ